MLFGSRPGPLYKPVFMLGIPSMDAGEYGGAIQKKVCGTDLAIEFRSQSQFVVRSNKYCSLETKLYTIIFILSADHLNKF